MKLLGYDASDYIGRDIASFHADEDAINDILARLTRGEAVERYPARLRARDGSLKHVEISSSGQFENGELVHTRCFTVDGIANQIRRAGDDPKRGPLPPNTGCIASCHLYNRCTRYNYLL
ncbi:PAS domain-containing protein [Mesorhizobium huakuii]|uniref:PAS domain-containing protein n=1 Tax=Mesorhizobium huakuii TaxID=28104 RepID=UPI001FD30049|nr:PAS domain-containing protein [Mesorhizobium huakuii]